MAAGEQLFQKCHRKFESSLMRISKYLVTTEAFFSHRKGNFGRQKSKNSKAQQRKMSIDEMLELEEELEGMDDDILDEFDGEEIGDGNQPNKKMKRKNAIKFKTGRKKSENIIAEEGASEESNDNPTEEEQEDDLFEDVFADIEPMEVSLCQLINETFKFDEDYEL